MNRAAYIELVRENLAWLDAQPKTLERDHIRLIVEQSVDMLYPRRLADILAGAGAPAADTKGARPEGRDTGGET